MASPLLSLAVGALAGAKDNRDQAERDRERKRREQQQDLETELQLRSTPGVSLEPTGARAAADVAQNLGGILGAGAGAIAPIGVGGGQAPGQAAGHVTLNNRNLDVRLDPTETPGGKAVAQDAANRAAHGALNKIDPTLWNQQYDPKFDYTAAARDEAKKSDTEKQLIAAGFTPEKARLLARTGLDVDKRNADIAARKATGQAAIARATSGAGAAAAGTLELKKAQQLEKDAGATALGWAQNGAAQNIPDETLQQQIADALAPMYPDLSYAQRVGVAGQAMLARTKATADIGAKNRSGVRGPMGARGIPGVKLPTPGAIAPVKTTAGGGVLGAAAGALSSTGTPPANSGPAAAAKPGKAVADKAAMRKQAIEELVDAGKSKDEIKAELKKRGLL